MYSLYNNFITIQKHNFIDNKKSVDALGHSNYVGTSVAPLSSVLPPTYCIQKLYTNFNNRKSIQISVFPF